MPIHDFSYRHWEGQRSGLPPAIVLGWSQLRVTTKRRWVRIPMLVALLLVLFWLTIVYVEAAPEDSPVAALRNIELVDIGLNAQTLYWFLKAQRVVGYFLCLVAGAEFIALDRRHKALQIYLARPLRVQDYLLGKGLPLMVLLSLTTWVPALLLLFLKSVATASLLWLRDEPWLPLSILAFSALEIATFTALTLAVSSLTASPRLGSVMLAVFFIFSLGVSNVMEALTRNEHWLLLSVEHGFNQTLAWMFDRSLPLDVSPWSALIVLALLTAACIGLLMRRIRPVDVVGSG